MQRKHFIRTIISMAGSLMIGFGGLGAFFAFKFNGQYDRSVVAVSVGLAVLVVAHQVGARR